jgi:hypothetical protein
MNDLITFLGCQFDCFQTCNNMCVQIYALQQNASLSAKWFHFILNEFIGPIERDVVNSLVHWMGTNDIHPHFVVVIKGPLPSSSIYASQEFLLPMLIRGTSPNHPYRAHRYAKIYHLGTASKSKYLYQWVPMISFLLELGFQLNPFTSMGLIPLRWTKNGQVFIDFGIHIKIISPNSNQQI